MAHDVFISHSSQDKLTADAICHSLEQNGIPCWIAPRDVRGGFDYGEEIIYGIENSKLMVLIFSEHSNDSPFVKSEIERAFSKSKIIIPYRLSQIEMSRGLELFLAGKHWIDAYPNDTVFDNLITAVKNALGINIAPVAAPAPKAPETPPVNETRSTATLAPLSANNQEITVGSTIHFGDFDWRVLDVKNDKALIITKDIIIRRAYDTNHNLAGYCGEEPPASLKSFSSTVVEGSMNNYLDTTFHYGESFSDFEREQMGMYTICDNDQTRTTLYPFIYLMSASEIETYFPNIPDRIALFEGNPCPWWLRGAKLNEYSDSATFVDERGNIVLSNIKEQHGVRPAMWIKMDSTDSEQHETAEDSKSAVVNGNVYALDSTGEAGNTPGNLYNDGNASIQGEWIYFASSSMLYKTKADGSGPYILLTDDAPQYTARINVIGDWIYYDDSNYRVSRIKTDGTSKEIVIDNGNTGVGNTTIIGNNLFCTKAIDGGFLSGASLIKMNLSTGESKTIKGKATFFAIVGDKIIGGTTYPTPVGEAKYTDCFVVDFDGNVFKTWREEHWISQLVESAGYYYFREERNENFDGKIGFYIMKKPISGDDAVQLVEGSAFTVFDDWIYYDSICDDGTSDGICKIKNDGSGFVKLTEGYGTRFSIVGEWIFYQGRDGSFRIKTDGTGMQKLP